MVSFPRERFSVGRAWALLLVVALAWALWKPQSFIDLWLTPDQQGQIWFALGEYDKASQAFDDPRWRGVSFYAAEDFATAAQYFSQYQDAESLLARANALAHQREYLDARAAYEDLRRRYPDNAAPAVNIPIVQELIDANRMMSENQQAESGDMTSDRDQGPRSSEGDERLSMLEREQISADDLLEDPQLTAMWLRQVQRNPSEFLSTKFYLQLEAREGVSP